MAERTGAAAGWPDAASASTPACRCLADFPASSTSAASKPPDALPPPGARQAPAANSSTIDRKIALRTAKASLPVPREGCGGRSRRKPAQNIGFSQLPQTQG